MLFWSLPSSELDWQTLMMVNPFEELRKWQLVQLAVVDSPRPVMSKITKKVTQCSEDALRQKDCVF